MLVTVPAQRATLTEVLNHPWILKGFTSAPAAHIPTRVPLRFGELDDEVVRGMTGFEFGTEAEISARLSDVVQSELYRQAVRNWENRGGSAGSGYGGAGEGSSGASDSDKERPAMRVDGKDMKRTPTGNKRFSGLGFYGKKLTSGFNAAFAGATAAPPRASDEQDPLGGVQGGVQGGSYGANGAFAAGNGTAPRPEQLDPTRGFHPLISIYYLVKEKIERERIWGPGVFASSTLSLTGPPPPPAPAQAYQAGSGAPLSPPVQVDSRPPMPTPPMPLTPQPRQRATGDEYAPVPATAPARAAGFDMSQPSTASKRTSYIAGSPAPTTSSRPPPQGEYEAPVSPSPRERKSSTNRMSLMLGSSAADRERERVAEIAAAGDDVPLAQAASGSSPGPFARRFGSLLGRSSSTSTSPDGSSYGKGHRQRASIATVGHKSGNKTAASTLPLVVETGSSPSSTLRPPATPTPAGRLPSSGSEVPLASPPDGKPVARASTVGDISPSSRHARGVSMAAGAASPLSQSVATSGGGAASESASLGRASGSAGFFERRRQGSVGGGGATRPPRPRTQNDIAGMFEEEDEHFGGGAGEPDDAGSAAAGRRASAAPAEASTSARQDTSAFGPSRSNDKASSSSDKGEGAKPVWLKGLFSVSTTTTKPIHTLRADLIQVLDRLGVQHRDVKNGFECAHVPSIDLSTVPGAGGAASSSAGKAKRDTLKRRASKLLLSHGSSQAGDKQPLPTGGAAESQQSLPTSTNEPRGSDRASSSSFHQPLPSTATAAGAAPSSQPGSASASPQQVDVSQFGGTSSSAANSDMIVRFEIFLIKMPLLPGIHGLQFRRIGGSTWQYQVLGASPLLFLPLETSLLPLDARLTPSRTSQLAESCRSSSSDDVALALLQK